MGDHRLVGGVRRFGDVEILLDDTTLVRGEGPVGAGTAAICVHLSDVVSSHRDKPAIANLHLAMEFQKPVSLSAVLGAESAAAEDEHHGMLALQLGELPAFRRVIGKFVVGENGSWNNVRSHMKSPQFDGFRINLPPARKRDKLPDPEAYRVRRAARA